MECVLLGGSNTVLRFGIGSGLESQVETKRLGLGATSCIQNLFELERNKDLARNAKFIVSESNVNDSFFAVSSPIDINIIKSEIDEYYRILSMTNRNIYVVLLPANHHAHHMERLEIIEQVNERHILNCLAHGFYIVNLSSITKSVPVQDLMNIMPHPRHLHEGLLHQVGVNIANHAKSNTSSRAMLKLTGPAYSVIESHEILAKTVEKSNSVFCENVAFLKKRLPFPKKNHGMEIVAIAAWPNGYTTIKIKNITSTTTKCFSKLYSVWELSKPFKITRYTTVETAFENPKPSEVSRLSKYNKANRCYVFGLVGFLVRDKTKEIFSPTAVYSYEQVDISTTIVPAIEPYIKAYRSFFEHRKIITLDEHEEIKKRLDFCENELLKLYTCELDHP